ncbi:MULTISPECIES: hypothetical protein [Acidiphilium]|uniref:hypothetical protein n=1 Tax=Acidiphilium TaxID=522 RepID=UPI0005B820C2|nr:MULTISPECIES: hypothetical protein [Acidiphilium]
MIRAVAVIALVMAPIVAGAAQPEEKAPAYQAQMQPMSSIVAVASRAASCKLRSRRWNALIQGASMIEAYTQAGALWGMQGKYLSLTALVHFEKMGDRCSGSDLPPPGRHRMPVRAFAMIPRSCGAWTIWPQWKAGPSIK